MRKFKTTKPQDSFDRKTKQKQKGNLGTAKSIRTLYLKYAVTFYTAISTNLFYEIGHSNDQLIMCLKK